MEQECAGALMCSVRAHVTCPQLSLSDNKIPDSMDVKSELFRAEAQHTQLQPFSFRFKNILVKLAGMCTFFEAMERSVE